jgi:hypothetical protein
MTNDNKINDLKVILFDIDNQIKILNERYKTTMEELNAVSLSARNAELATAAKAKEEAQK